MKTFKEMIESYQKQGLGSEKVMWQSIGVIDEMILSHIKEHEPEFYWDFMREIHELYLGGHYNEEFGKWEVSQMHHKGTDGKIYKGEHWTVEQVSEVYEKYKSKLKKEDTVWDVYVAVHSYWHDNCVKYKEWFGEDYEAKIIEGCLNYFFLDEDAPSGKIWFYYKGMREGKSEQNPS